MTPSRGTPHRSIRVPDETWRELQAEAALAGESVTDLLLSAAWAEVSRRRTARERGSSPTPGGPTSGTLAPPD